MSLEDALSQTEEEEQEMLPDGINTENNSLMVIENLLDNRNVGVYWYLYEETRGVQQVSLCDFVLYELERRKGYVTEALNVMEQNATEFGCKESVLFEGFCRYYNENDITAKMTIEIIVVMSFKSLSSCIKNYIVLLFSSIKNVIKEIILVYNL